MAQTATPATLTRTLSVQAVTLTSGSKVARIAPLTLTLDVAGHEGRIVLGPALTPNMRIERVVYDIWLSGGGLNPVAIPAVGVDIEVSLAETTVPLSQSLPTSYVSGSIFGGPMRIANGGESWTAGDTGEAEGRQFLSVRAAPSNPRVVYAGTEQTGFATVFRSADGGRSFARTNGPLVETNMITVDSSDPNKVWVASFGGGLWYSADGGAIWQPRNSGLPNGNFNEVYVTGSYVIAPNKGFGVYKSADGGQTWASSNTGLTGTPPTLNTNTMCIAANGTLYLGVDASKVYKSTDDGASWSDITASLSSPSLWNLSTDPNDSSIVMGAGAGFVAISTNGGTSWTLRNSSHGLPNTGNYFVGGFGNNGDLFAGVVTNTGKPGGPMWRSTAASGGASWSLVSAGIPTEWVNFIATSPSGLWIATPKVAASRVSDQWQTVALGSAKSRALSATINISTSYSVDLAAALEARAGGRVKVRRVEIWTDGSRRYQTLTDSKLVSFDFTTGRQSKLSITCSEPTAETRRNTGGPIVLNPSQILRVTYTDGLPEWAMVASVDVQAGDVVTWDSVNYLVAGVKYVLAGTGRVMVASARTRTITQGSSLARSVTLPVFSGVPRLAGRGS